MYAYKVLEHCNLDLYRLGGKHLAWLALWTEQPGSPRTVRLLMRVVSNRKAMFCVW